MEPLQSIKKVYWDHQWALAAVIMQKKLRWEYDLLYLHGSWCISGMSSIIACLRKIFLSSFGQNVPAEISTLALTKLQRGSCCISHQMVNLCVYLQQSFTTSVWSSASCHVGSCNWTWVSADLNPPLPTLSVLRPKTFSSPKVTAAPYICPPALCPDPSVLGAVGVEWLQEWLKGM